MRSDKMMNMSIGMHSDQRQLPPNRDLVSDIEETTAFLTEKGWLHRQFTADGTERWGLVFAEPGHVTRCSQLSMCARKK
jgi:hypothetical protein